MTCDDGDTSLLAKTLCENGRAKTGSEFTSRLAPNTPEMMFVFLPLMSLVSWLGRKIHALHWLGAVA